jgi:SAM-dependent methyltransferase
VSALLGASPPWREHSLLPLAALDGRGGDDAATPPAGTADCVVAAGTLAAVRDLPAAFARLRSLLAPGGVLILTLPGIAPPPGPAGAGALRTFTTMSAERLATAAFGVPPVEVRAFGNPLSAVCMLHRLPADTLSAEELWLHHPDFPLLVGLVARTPA